MCTNLFTKVGGVIDIEDLTSCQTREHRRHGFVEFSLCEGEGFVVDDIPHGLKGGSVEFEDFFYSGNCGLEGVLSGDVYVY